MSSMYRDGTYGKNNPNWHQEESPWKARQVIEALGRNSISPSTVCDIGCGAGEVLRILSESLPAGVVCSGYDISPQAHELSSRKARPNLSFHLSDMPDGDERYDLILALDIVEHVEDYIGFLRRLKSRARYKLLHIPLDLAVQRLLRISTLLDDMERVGHLHFFTKETALAALQRAEYRIIEASFIPKRIDLSLGGRKAQFLKLPRKALFAMNRDLASRLFGGWSLSVLAE